ncbi:MAG: MerR family transcriptional regulator [Spirulinaceae cyanobacterium]
MESLNKLAQSKPHWSLSEFVEVLNNLLPQFLPVQRSHTKVRETITPRLVRHYTSQGMVDDPQKEGRYAIYTYRHLLQMLVVRRLLAEGYGASAIQNLPKTKDNSDLEALLQGGIQLTVTAANPALGFLQEIKQRQPLSKTPKVATKKSPSGFGTTDLKWTRLEIVPGLEIHLREDFAYPHSLQEQENLLQYIAQKLKTL